MSITVRPAKDRGPTRIDWLDSRHTFSFGHYYDPHYMGFGPLRVINEDRVAPGAGFDTHAHDNMEIVTLVLDGALEHRDSLGTGSVIRPGDVQRMSAGSGIAHSEFNASKDAPVHFLQIWVQPEIKHGRPDYAQRSFDSEARRDRWQLWLSPDGVDDSLSWRQQATLSAARLSPKHGLDYALAPGRQAWLHVVRGALSVEGTDVAAGDGVAITDANSVHLQGGAQDADVILFDLP